MYSYICVSLTHPTCQPENFRPPEGNIVHETVETNQFCGYSHSVLSDSVGTRGL